MDSNLERTATASLYALKEGSRGDHPPLKTLAEDHHGIFWYSLSEGSDDSYRGRGFTAEGDGTFPPVYLMHGLYRPPLGLEVHITEGTIDLNPTGYPLTASQYGEYVRILAEFLDGFRNDKGELHIYPVSDQKDGRSPNIMLFTDRPPSPEHYHAPRHVPIEFKE